MLNDFFTAWCVDGYFIVRYVTIHINDVSFSSNPDLVVSLINVYLSRINLFV